MRGPRTFRSFLLIVLAAAAVRGVWTWANSNGPDELRGDAVFFFQGARHLLKDHALVDDSGNRAVRLPLYPAFLAAVFSVAGTSVAAAQAAQCLLGALTCGIIYLGALGFAAEEAALLAGWSAVFYYGLIGPCGRLLAESFYSFWLTVLFAAWFRCRGRWKEPAIAALSSAALYLTRPEGALAGLAVAAFGPGTRRGWKLVHSLAVVACLGAVMLAWGARNQRALGRFTPGTTGAGFSFWAGLPRTMSEKLSASPSVAWAPAGASEQERDAYYWKLGADQLRSTPPLALAKAAAFNLASAYYPFLPRFELTYVLLVPLWLWAFWAGLRRRELWPAMGVLVAWSALYVVFGGHDSRFRQSFAPLLLWLAAAGFEDLRGRIPLARLQVAAGLWASLNVFVFLFASRARLLALFIRDALWGIR
ncbi:MAG: hypothetical protein NTX64_14650 [Elusimicrobia bacterium]|nr:hypothetical protein [Elusimicrobiota bacterium]